MIKNMIKKIWLKRYDIKYDIDFYECINMINKNMIGQKYDKTDMIKVSKNSKIW